MKNIVLLGDSIFDNAVYINGGTDVTGHLRNKIPSDWKADLRAVDGTLVENVREQLFDLPDSATHLVLSVGGNNALMNSDVLQMKTRSSAEFLSVLADRADHFELQYAEMLKSVLSLGKKTAVCTIYYPRMPERIVQKVSVAALTVFNDVIIRQAFLAKIPLIDLRLVCREDSDYANEIEPSETGGEKIASAILNLIENYDFETRRTQVFY